MELDAYRWYDAKELGDLCDDADGWYDAKTSAALSAWFDTKWDYVPPNYFFNIKNWLYTRSLAEFLWKYHGQYLDC